jgi:hypothetical protein
MKLSNPEINKAQNLITPKYIQNNISKMQTIINTKLRKSEANASHSTLTMTRIKKQKKIIIIRKTEKSKNTL